MAKVLVIPCDESKPIRLVEASGFEEYKNLLEMGPSDLLEACVPYRRSLATNDIGAYVDEEGLLKELPVNDRLMYLFGNNNSGMGLRGNALVFAMDEEGDERDLPDRVLSEVRHLGLEILDETGIVKDG